MLSTLVAICAGTGEVARPALTGWRVLLDLHMSVMQPARARNPDVWAAVRRDSIHPRKQQAALVVSRVDRWNGRPCGVSVGDAWCSNQPSWRLRGPSRHGTGLA